MPLTGKEKLLMYKLKLFFEKEENIKKIKPIIQGESKISLSILDWFVTNYTQYNKIYCTIKIQGREKKYRLYDEYKNQLKSHSKKRFDPFCRSDSIILYYNKSEYIQTAVCQLNFLRWVIEANVLDKIQEHYEEIEKDMKEKKKSKKKKRKST